MIDKPFYLHRVPFCVCLHRIAQKHDVALTQAFGSARSAVEVAREAAVAEMRVEAAVADTRVETAAKEDETSTAGVYPYAHVRWAVVRDWSVFGGIPVVSGAPHFCMGIVGLPSLRPIALHPLAAGPGSLVPDGPTPLQSLPLEVGAALDTLRKAMLGACVLGVEMGLG
jgi:hypothetical protein